MTIHRRGKPDNGDVVHRYMDVPRRYLEAKETTVCTTGNYHIFYTENQNHVTCPRCLELLNKKDYCDIRLEKIELYKD